MSVKLRNVDLGPISLQVSEEVTLPALKPKGGEADPAEVQRFNSILHRHRRDRHGRGGQHEPAVTPEALLGSLPEPDAGDLADADEIGSEIAHLWVGTGLRSAREVRIGLRQSLLPDSQLRIYEVQDRLRVEFSCRTHRAADWLDRKLDVLARELGERLDRDIELAVFMGDGHLVRACNWSREVS